MRRCLHVSVRGQLLGKRFKEKVERHGELRHLMLHYTQALLTQTRSCST